MNRIPTAISTYLLCTPLVTASEIEPELSSTDRSNYSLLNPTPRELWRPLSADRPDFTESPYTVDAGAVQIEMSFVDYAENGDEDTWTFAQTNLKVGLLNSVDIQFVFTPSLVRDDGTQTQSETGDTQIRLKINLWGNDDGETALAIMPFIKLPTASGILDNERVEGGVIFPFAIEITDGIGLGLMFEADFVYDTLDDDYDIEFVTTGMFGFDITERTGVYVEGIGISSTDSDVQFRGILGLGATYELTKNMVLDAGVNIGLSGASDDINLFTGITIRF
jgi:Putative MetA-pathway of phenol degradation